MVLGHVWWWGGMYIVGGGMCGWECTVGGGYGWRGGMCGRGHEWGDHAWVAACVAGEMATAADSTHPTGMHFCC